MSYPRLPSIYDLATLVHDSKSGDELIRSIEIALSLTDRFRIREGGSWGVEVRNFLSQSLILSLSPRQVVDIFEHFHEDGIFITRFYAMIKSRQDSDKLEWSSLDLAIEPYLHSVDFFWAACFVISRQMDRKHTDHEWLDQIRSLVTHLPTLVDFIEAVENEPLSGCYDEHWGPVNKHFRSWLERHLQLDLRPALSLEKYMEGIKSIEQRLVFLGKLMLMDEFKCLRLEPDDSEPSLKRDISLYVMDYCADRLQDRDLAFDRFKDDWYLASLLFCRGFQSGKIKLTNFPQEYIPYVDIRTVIETEVNEFVDSTGRASFETYLNGLLEICRGYLCFFPSLDNLILDLGKTKTIKELLECAGEWEA